MSKLTLTKTTSAIFLAIVLVTGTITSLSFPSFIIKGMEAQAQPYYGMDKDRKVVSVSSLKCNNINVNVNGLELEILPSALSTLLTGEEADASAYSYGSGTGNYGSGQSSSENDFRFICINNNNNIVVGGREGGGNVIEPTATLAVTKTVTCTPNDTFPPAAAACQFIRSNVLPSSFNIVVTGNEPHPSEIAGSNDPVIVNLGAGNYEVTEDVPLFVPPGGNLITRTTSFAEGCIDVDPNDPQSTEAAGTIEAGESQTCNISNDYRVSSGPLGGDLTTSNINTAGGLTASFSPSTIAQGIGNAPEITATEKIVKLKQQWMELLP